MRHRRASGWRLTSTALVGTALVALYVTAAGCGSSGASKAPVKGKVTANGQPVTGGTVLLMPGAEVKAQQASGAVGADGTFVLMTEKAGDGAAIGKHTVNYAAPNPEQAEWDGYGKEPPIKESPYSGLAPKETEFEVKAGQNELNIELVPVPLPGGGFSVPGR